MAQNKSYPHLWSLIRSQRQRYIVAILAMAMTNIFLFAAPIIGGQALDVIKYEDFGQGNVWITNIARTVFGELSYFSYILVASACTLFVTMIGGVFLFARGRLAATASESIIKGLREAIYNRLHHISAHFYDTADTGDLVQRASSDVETLRVFLASDVIEIGRAIMLVLCLLPILFAIHAPLAWWSLAIMPILVLGAYIFFSKVKHVFEITDASEGAMTATLQENLTGIRVVRAFARQQHEIEKFGGKNATFRDNNYLLIRLMGWYWGTSDFFAMLQLGLVLFAGATYVLAGSLTVGELFIFMTCESMVIWPVRQLGRVLTDTGKAVVSLERVNHILQEPEESVDQLPERGRAKGDIRLRNVTLAYAEGEPVLRDLSLDIPAGTTMAIVGPPGAGKTSLIRALLRLYPYQSGSITVDGFEVSDTHRQWLRAQIGVVLQDPFLYSRSIRDNLAVGRSHAPDEDVVQACEDAAILNSIHAFPDGFSAMVGERGVTLSGGQRQRLALARALLKDPPILVLDDSLSAVDTGTEADILAAMKRRKGRRTTIIIAHRLSSVIDADVIALLDSGRLVQLGDHTTLASQEGPYRRLCEIQGALDKSIQRDIDLSHAGG